MFCTEVVSDIQNNFCTQHVPCSAKRRASDKDLPVHIKLIQKEKYINKYILKKGTSPIKTLVVKH